MWPRLPSFVTERLERANLRRIVANAGWLVGGRTIRLAFGLLVTVLLARYLGPSSFGLLSYAIAFVAIFGVVAQLGIGEIVIRDLVRSPGDTGETLGTAFVLHLLGGIVGIGLIVVAILVLRAGQTLAVIMVSLLSLTLLFKAAEVVRYYFDSQVQSRYTVWVEDGVFVLMGILRLGLIYVEAPLIVFVGVLVVESALVAVGFLAMYAHRGGAMREWKPRVDRGVRLLKDCWPLALAGIAVIVYMRIDQLMIGEMIGADAVGIYSAAVRLSELWYFVPTAIVGSTFPLILAQQQDAPVQYEANLQKLYDGLAMLAVAVALVFTVISDSIVHMLFGEPYAGAGVVLGIHVWGGVFVALGIARGKWLVAEGLQRLSYWYVGLAMLVNVLGNLVLIPLAGIVGAAIATLLAQVTAALIAPALFRDSRRSVVMLLASLNPVRWPGAIREL